MTTGTLRSFAAKVVVAVSNEADLRLASAFETWDCLFLPDLVGPEKLGVATLVATQHAQRPTSGAVSRCFIFRVCKTLSRCV